MRTVHIIFSPTGGTERVARIISDRWGGEVETIDLSNPQTDFAQCEITPEDQALVAMPSFGGRASRGGDRTPEADQGQRREMYIGMRIREPRLRGHPGGNGGRCPGKRL